MINYLYFITILTFHFFTLSCGFPNSDKKQTSLFGLPFLELTNDGIKVGFGGYHAEAGLGGILGGSGKGGGLYAGAGTPFGAHAYSGLGGTVSGEKSGSTGGGLYAGAGLGHGTEVVAGADGLLSGSDPSQNGGRVFAGSSHAGKTKTVTKTLSNDPSNIQPISKTTKLEIFAEKPANQMVRREAETVEDKILSDPMPDSKLTSESKVTESPGSFAYSTRRCRRKRLCNNYVRKTLLVNQQSSFPAGEVAQLNVVPGLNEVSGDPVPANSDDHGKRADHLVPQNTGYAGSYLPTKSRTIFDDIFNIPISTLNAVNQLLNSKVG